MGPPEVSILRGLPQKSLDSASQVPHFFIMDFNLRFTMPEPKHLESWTLQRSVNGMAHYFTLSQENRADNVWR